MFWDCTKCPLFKWQSYVAWIFLSAGLWLSTRSENYQRIYAKNKRTWWICKFKHTLTAQDGVHFDVRHVNLINFQLIYVYYETVQPTFFSLLYMQDVEFQQNCSHTRPFWMYIAFRFVSIFWRHAQFQPWQGRGPATVFSSVRSRECCCLNMSKKFVASSLAVTWLFIVYIFTYRLESYQDRTALDWVSNVRCEHCLGFVLLLSVIGYKKHAPLSQPI